jgi:hypothetical protein
MFFSRARAGRSGRLGRRETNAHPSSSRVDFSAYHLVTERNIFNPQRSERGDNRRSESRAPKSGFDATPSCCWHHEL